ncbi:MAG: winged helix-turn-helix domain-containing protein, partial [Sphingomicrobium sp.]
MKLATPVPDRAGADTWRLDLVNEWVLPREGDAIRLTPKAFGVLRFLAERSGQLVGKQDLLDAIWRDSVVGEAVLATAVREIRKELGDDAAQPRLIETVHRRGYRLIGRVIVEAAVSTPPVTEHAPTTIPSRVSTTVGRESELARLRACWDAALRGERRVLFITADAGIGKTALADAFLADDG